MSANDFIAIVGGGITGLSAANFVREEARKKGSSIKCIIIEKEKRLGGTILTEKLNGYTIEAGPDCFLTEKTAALELCREIGIGDRILQTQDVGRTYVLWNGRLHEIPEGIILMVPTRFMPFLNGGLFSLSGKIRMGMEVFVPRSKHEGDESLADFVRRRFGQEALLKIADPLAAGVHAGDPETMSLRATFPRFIEMEQRHGSLIRGMVSMRHGRAAASMSVFAALRDGLGEMIQALARALPKEWLRPGTSVTSLRKAEKGYEVLLNNGETLKASAVILASPAYAASGIVKELSPALSELLNSIPYVSTATVSIGYRRKDVPHPLNGFGFVVPRAEKRKIMAATWTSSKFSFRAPEGKVLLRFFVGGAHGQNLLEMDDDALVEIVREESGRILGITAEPDIVRLYRWDRAMPQYVLGHLTVLRKIDDEARKFPGLFFAGSAYRGIGIPDCITEGKKAARSAMEFQA